jgi:hypothetical protein
MNAVNSLLPLSAPKKNIYTNMFSGSTNIAGNTNMWIVYLGIPFIILSILGVLYYFFNDEFMSAWTTAQDIVKGFFGKYPDPPPPPPPPPPPEEKCASSESAPAAAPTVEKVLPGATQVFNVSSNKYTYYDAEPLCKALGAELATYDQVKEAWSKGADWCNYGWTKGQMALYPTSDETYKKLQSGTEDQRLSCGTAGVNGGYFDNPELRYGVNCYGVKPAQTGHEVGTFTQGAPMTPDAIEFDKKVAEFKSESDVIGILPFNASTWQ